MSPRSPDSRLNATALLALLVGIFGTVCFFWGIGGIGAVVLGLVALSEIKRSEGRQHGQGFAIAGIALGGLHLFALTLGLAAMFVFSARPPSFLSPTPPRLPHPTSFLPPPTHVAPAPAPVSGSRPGAFGREPNTKTTELGKITLVDPGTEVTSFEKFLEGQQRLAASDHQKLVLWVSSSDCTPCNGVSVALLHRRMQEALAGVRLVRVDIADFHVELVKLGIPIDVMPGFALLTSDGSPADYVNGGEWDADIPENIAPVLGSFVRGSYRTRRNPWSGPHRSDETAL
ncbi:MAG TPA: DUF4190 domain-containing protein [Polyangiaceae bacterium]|nr:DUF4190 domain-containing protein [Polyangiaceae bacterium]